MAIEILGATTAFPVVGTSSGSSTRPVPAGTELVLVALEWTALATDTVRSITGLTFDGASILGNSVYQTNFSIFGSPTAGTYYRGGGLYWARVTTSGAKDLVVSLDGTGYAMASLVYLKNVLSFGTPVRLTATQQGVGTSLSGGSATVDSQWLAVGLVYINNDASTSLAATGVGHSLIASTEIFGSNKLHLALSSVQEPAIPTYTQSTSLKWNVVTATVAPAVATASVTVSLKTPTVTAGSQSYIFIDTPLTVGALHFLSASYAVVREVRTTITDMTQSGRWVSLELSRTSDSADFEVQLVDLDVRFRGRRVWRDI